MFCLHNEWHQLQVWVKDLFIHSGTSDLYPYFPFGQPMQSDTYNKKLTKYVEHNLNI